MYGILLNIKDKTKNIEYIKIYFNLMYVEYFDIK